MLYLAAIGRAPRVRKWRHPPRLEVNNSLWGAVSAVIWHGILIMPVATLFASVLLVLTYQWATSGDITAFKVGVATASGGLTMTILGILMSRLQDRGAERRHREITEMLKAIAERQEKTSSQIVAALNAVAERLEAAIVRDDDGPPQDEENVP